MTEDQLRAELAEVHASTSWRVTAPLRLIGALVKRARFHAARPRRFFRAVLSRMVRSAALRKLGTKVLEPFPFLRDRVRRIALSHMLGPTLSTTVGYPVAETEIELSLPARRVLAELREARRKAAQIRAS